jgi:hypothetical protein
MGQQKFIPSVTFIRYLYLTLFIVNVHYTILTYLLHLFMIVIYA